LDPAWNVGRLGDGGGLPYLQSGTAEIDIVDALGLGRGEAEEGALAENGQAPELELAEA